MYYFFYSRTYVSKIITAHYSSTKLLGYVCTEIKIHLPSSLQIPLDFGRLSSILTKHQKIKPLGNDFL